MRASSRRWYRRDPVRTIELVIVGWCVVSLVFWVWYTLVTGTMIPFVIYYPIWLGVAGTLFWRNRGRISSRLQEWRAPAPVKFLLLGFGAVMTEEIVAALANHVPEGFSPTVFLARILQFWDLNIFTFFGFIVGWYGLNRYLTFSRREVFWLAGAWGLYAEKVIFALPSNPLFVLFDFSPTVLTYGLIIMPALFSQNDQPGRARLHPLIRYPLAYGLIFLCSVPAILVLQILRLRVPALFPPSSLVPL